MALSKLKKSLISFNFPFVARIHYPKKKITKREDVENFFILK